MAPHTAILHRHRNWPYQAGLDFMARARESVGAGGPFEVAVGDHQKPVVTLGRHTAPTEVMGRGQLERDEVSIIRTERGGGATWHGPGQLMAYPVVRLPALGLSVDDFVRSLAQAMIDTLSEVGILGIYEEKEPGVYVAGAKIGSIGLHLHKGVTTHGLALNVNNRLDHFGLIAACGMVNRPMTSAAREVGETSELFSTLQVGLISAIQRHLMLEWRDDRSFKQGSGLPPR